MSHFAVLVAGTDPEYQLAPFHEFECTGQNDEFVQDVDVTEDCIKEGLEYYGLEDRIIAPGETPNTNGKHKYGYAVKEDETLVRAIKRTNPNKKWDWYQIGGRYSGRLLLKNGQRDNVARKGEVDWEGIERAAATEATTDYQLARISLDKHPPFETWPTVREKHGNDMDAARKEYNEQPAVAAFRTYNKENDYRFGLMEGPDQYTIPLPHFVQQAVDRSFCLFAFVKDRQWQEKGEMGWFACVSNEKDQADWNRTFRAFVQSLPDDEILTVVDCHI